MGSRNHAQSMAAEPLVLGSLPPTSEDFYLAILWQISTLPDGLTCADKLKRAHTAPAHTQMDANKLHRHTQHRTIPDGCTHADKLTQAHSASTNPRWTHTCHSHRHTQLFPTYLVMVHLSRMFSAKCSSFQHFFFSSLYRILPSSIGVSRNPSW